MADGADGLLVLRRAERQREVGCNELVDALRVNDLSDTLFVATGKEYKVVSGEVKGGIRPRHGVGPFRASDHGIVLGNDGLGGSKEQLGDALQHLRVAAGRGALFCRKTNLISSILEVCERDSSFCQSVSSAVPQRQRGEELQRTTGVVTVVAHKEYNFGSHVDGYVIVSTE